MPRYSEEIVNYAKELYLTVDDKGNRVYSFKDISTAIRQKFNVEIDRTTIYQWAKRKGWDKLLHQAIVVSAYDEESKKETEATITKVVEKLPPTKS